MNRPTPDRIDTETARAALRAFGVGIGSDEMTGVCEVTWTPAQLTVTRIVREGGRAVVIDGEVAKITHKIAIGPSDLTEEGTVITGER